MTNNTLDDRLAVEAEHDRLEALADDWRDRDSAWELANDEPECSQGPQSDSEWSGLVEPPFRFLPQLDCYYSSEDDDIPF